MNYSPTLQRQLLHAVLVATASTLLSCSATSRGIWKTQGSSSGATINIAVPALGGRVVVQDDQAALVDPKLVVGSIYEYDSSAEPDGKVPFRWGNVSYYKNANSLVTASDPQRKYYSMITNAFGGSANALGFAAFSVDGNTAREISIDRINFAAIKLGELDYNKIDQIIQQYKRIGRDFTKIYLIREVYVYVLTTSDYLKISNKTQVDQGISAVGIGGNVYATITSKNMNKTYYTVMNLSRFDDVELEVMAFKSGQPVGTSAAPVEGYSLPGLGDKILYHKGQ